MAHASSSKVCKYDVFLSFRGEDTRRNFVSHLYNALEQRGIHAFKDDVRLEKGKSISDELLKAIEEARFAIVIFSRKYASSRWCLEELAHIIKCKNELQQIVIPVFYDVSPSDVRHQNPPFAKSFSKHEKKYKDDMEKVQSWRDAFANAGKLSGYHLINYKDEADCIKKLVDDIFPKLLQVISSFPENLVGMESRVEKVASLLDMESNDVRSIGIWGMAGVGKTEIAKVLHQRYRHRFEADCFLGDVGTLYQKNGLAWLAELVISKILGEKMTLASEHEGVNILNNMLCRKKVLFILDDLNHREQLELLVGRPERFGKGSRIILTARDKHLLISHVGDNVYEVELLSDYEAFELFSRHAFKEKSPKEDFMELSRQMLEYAGRLPLALKVLGSSVYRRNKEEWKDIIETLKKIPNDDITGKLKIGLNGLNQDEMRIFLDITCMFNHKSRYYVESILRSCDIHPLIGISRLIEKSLLSIDRDWGRLRMHSLIIQMGQDVSRKEYPNNRIWLVDEVHDLFAGKLKTKKVESLLIPKGYCFEDDHVKNSKVFKRMQSLQVLILDQTIRSECTVTCLPSSLRWIEWPNYPSSSLPEMFDPSYLVGLFLPRSRLVELWPIPKKLNNLKYLDLLDSFDLTKTPNFGDMPNLETLHLWGCSNLEEVHPALGYCRKLTTLDLSDCVKLKKLPRFVTMESLETLVLLNCTSLEEFPEICGDMRHLSTLYVESPWIRSLPPSLTGLRKLSLEGSEVLAMLPNNLFESQQLEELRIDKCSRLVELPVSLGVQKKLGKLYISKCENLNKLSTSIQMESLYHLDISDCPKLYTFPEIKGDMHCLKKLTLVSTGIRELPSSIGNLSGLAQLEISNCPKLYIFPEIKGNMHCLKELTMISTGMRELPSSIGNLSGLTMLNLNGWEDLVSLPDSLCNLMNLQCLRLAGCKKLEKLPENIGDLQKLKTLNASKTAISQPPCSITKLVKLRDVSFSNCQNLSELPGELPRYLERLFADYHLVLTSFRDLVNKCLNLFMLSISWCGHEKSESRTVSIEQVNAMKLLQHFVRTHIQYDISERTHFLIASPEVQILELFDYQFINQKKVSINLNPSWYDKFMGFSICYCNSEMDGELEAALVGKSGSTGKYYLRYDVLEHEFNTPVMWYFYIPFDIFWESIYEGGMNPNDYYLFEVSARQQFKFSPLGNWGIRLEYEKKLRRWRRKQRAAESPKLFSVSRKDDAATTEIGRSMVDPEPSLASSSSQKFTKHNVATDTGLHLGNENKDQEPKSQNVELIKVCGSPSRKMDDASRKRKRKRNRKKKRVIARTTETSCSHYTN